MHQEVTKERLPVRIPSVFGSETKFMTWFCSCFPTWARSFGSLVSHWTKGPSFSLLCASLKHVKVGEEIRVHKFLSSTRNRELTFNNSGCCAWSLALGERQTDKPDKNVCCPFTGGVRTCCNLRRRVIGQSTALQAFCRG